MTFNQRKRHIDGDKTIFGVTKRFDSTSVVELILKQERTAEYIVERLWQHFISRPPTSEELSVIANSFRENNYNIATAPHRHIEFRGILGCIRTGAMVKSP